MKPKPKLSDERIATISNHVSEEYLDHGKTDFATKAELCETILYMRKIADDNFQKFSLLRSELALFAASKLLS